MSTGLIRKTQGIQWKDDLAWMEPMKGDQWNTLLHKYQKQWKDSVKDVAYTIPKLRHTLEKSLDVGKQMRFSAGNVEIGHLGTMAYSWRWKGSLHSQQSLQPNIASDICVKKGSDVVYISYEDSSEVGAEKFILAAYTRGSKVALWEKHGMGPYIGILGERCYGIACKKKLVYYKLVSWLAKDGSDMRVEYEENDPRYNLELVKGRDVLFIRRQSGPKQDVFQLSNTSTLLEGIRLESRRFVFGCVSADEYIVWNGEDDKWKVSEGLKRRGYVFPSFQQSVPEYIDTSRNLLITKWYGTRILWKLSKHPPTILWEGVGNLLIDPWDSNWMKITIPGIKTIWEKTTHLSLKNAHKTIKRYFAISADSTPIPFYFVGTGKKGLFISAYSAYGLSSNFSTARWTPLLQEGWTICLPIFRGAGDHTPRWEDDGRLSGRLRVLEDAEAVVREARRLCNMDADRTVLYGRSAGGLWVGGLCSKFPKGDLFGCAYMEVPYLDVLRTTTNHDLPLTLLETDEFGLPNLRVSDLYGILQWSPMDTLPENGTPGIFQIVRTGLNDPQVFAYESVKWIVRCQAGSNAHPRKKQLLAIESDQGHFVLGSLGIHQQAEDIAILLEHVKNLNN